MTRRDATLLRSSRVVRAGIRMGMTAFQWSRHAYWYVTRPLAYGVHAVTMDAKGEVVLIRNTYARGWRLPGGGVKRRETPQQAILRELREEIGLRGYGAMRAAFRLEHRPEHRRGLTTIFVVEEADYSAAPSIEIEAIAAFPIDALPEGATPLTRRLLEAFRRGESYVVWQAWK